jgi:hypothetical protein
MKVDAEEVHVEGQTPAFAKLLEAPIKKFIQQTFQKESTRSP